MQAVGYAVTNSGVVKGGGGGGGGGRGGRPSNLFQNHPREKFEPFRIGGGGTFGKKNLAMQKGYY